MSIEQAFMDACDEIGCAYDNEALLMAIHELKEKAGPGDAPTSPTIPAFCEPCLNPLSENKP